MNIRENQMIGALVAKDYRNANVFKNYGIDFCCQGNRTIKEACEKKNLDEKLVIADLNAIINASSNPTVDYQLWPLDLLADYIEKKHHRYVQEKTIEIQAYLDKICKVHGLNHPELLEIKLEFDASAAELAIHMKKEELILFPYVRKMVKAQEENQKLTVPQFGTVMNPVQMMMSEHSTEGERFRRISSLSHYYTAPQDACNTFKVTFALLQEFEIDLHLHIHLENNILFPKAIELESTLMKTVV